MERFFNTAGPCDPRKHYMLPPERRLPEVEQLLAREQYFVVHAPRQVGKTTTFRALAHRLTATGSHAALWSTCEAGQSLSDDLEGSIDAVIDTLRQEAALQLPEALRPPEELGSFPVRTRFRGFLAAWAERSPIPVVLFLDEIDSLMDEGLISLLRQLRSGYTARPSAFPASVALIGLRDVRDYRLMAREETDRGPTLGTASPFNIKVRSFTLRNFTEEEVAELYAQHTEATGQVWAKDAIAHAFELTQGQPWLANALADQITSHDLRDRSQPIELHHVERAREALILRRDTHLDSLIARLREPRVRRVLAAVLAGEALPADLLDDDITFVEDLGLVRDGHQGLEIANPIYREIIPRALTDTLERSVALPRPSYVAEDGRLEVDQILDDFCEFWREHAEEYLARAPYSEAAAQLVFLAFLHKITNGKGGLIDREYAAGRGRLDLCIRWPLPGGSFQREAIELKVWRDSHRFDVLAKGKDQLARYLEILGLDRGTLVLFDDRSDAEPLPQRIRDERIKHRGFQIRLLWL